VSQENVALVRTALAACSAGGVEAVLPFYAPDVVWFPAAEWPEDSAYQGYDAIRRQDALWTGNFEDYGWEGHEIRDVHDRVLALAEMRGRTKDAAVVVSQRVGLVAGFRDAKIAEVRAFNTWREALKAVGLAE
jgi:ketosteroid isomerase-like protein